MAKANTTNLPFLKQRYLEKVVPELRKTRGYTNPHQVPTLVKIVINSAFNAEADKSTRDEVVKEITKLAGQKPVVPRLARAFRTSRFVKACPSVARSLSVAPVCGISLPASPSLLCR